MRAIGTWGLAAGIVNVTIGGGIFRLPSGVAAALGAAAPLAYLACAASMGLIVLCFAEAGSRVSMTGGPYAYVETAFGPFIGFLSGMLLWVGITLALAAVASFFGDALAAMVPSRPPWGKRTALVAKAIFAAMGVVTLLYVLIQVVAQGLLGPALAHGPTPLASAAAVAMGPAGRTLILVGSVVSMFGYVSGMMLSVPRMLFAFGRDGFLPSMLARTHPAWRTPHVAIAVQTVIVAVLAIFGYFELLAVAANITILLVYAACCLAAFELRRRDVRMGGVPFRVPAARVVPWAALAVIIWMLSSVTRNEWLAALAIVACATAVYFVTLSSRRARYA